MRPLTLLLGPLLAALPSCVNLEFNRAVEAEPLTDDVAARIHAGTSNLQACLEHFGAPRAAFEQPEGRFALAWAWRDEFEWGVSVSFSIRTGASLSYRWNDTQLDIPAILVLFDEKLVAQQVRRGNLREITQDLSRPKRSSVSD